MVDAAAFGAVSRLASNWFEPVAPLRRKRSAQSRKMP
jgi:hypothetical protein